MEGNGGNYKEIAETNPSVDGDAIFKRCLRKFVRVYACSSVYVLECQILNCYY